MIYSNPKKKKRDEKNNNNKHKKKTKNLVAKTMELNT